MSNGQSGGNGGDDWESFDFTTWGADDTPSPDGRGDRAQHGDVLGDLSDLEDGDELAARRTRVSPPEGLRDLGDALLLDEEDGRAGWVHEGGMVRWQEADGADEPEREDLRTMATSPWAADDLDMPLGAPPRTRIRGVRAWLARQRLEMDAAQGEVLLARRRMESDGTLDEAGNAEALEVALTEFAASADEFEALIELLSETENHVGPGQVLVEYHLALEERLAALAAAPEAPEGYSPPGMLLAPVERPSRSTASPTLAERNAWLARADAVTATRRRVERLTLPEMDE